jgi:hypothetical protein
MRGHTGRMRSFRLGAGRAFLDIQRDDIFPSHDGP